MNKTRLISQSLVGPNLRDNQALRGTPAARDKKYPVAIHCAMELEVCRLAAIEGRAVLSIVEDNIDVNAPRTIIMACPHNINGIGASLADCLPELVITSFLPNDNCV